MQAGLLLQGQRAGHLLSRQGGVAGGTWSRRLSDGGWRGHLCLLCREFLWDNATAPGDVNTQEEGASPFTSQTARGQHAARAWGSRVRLATRRHGITAPPSPSSACALSTIKRCSLYLCRHYFVVLFQMSTSFKMFLDNWNIQTALWLKRYVPPCTVSGARGSLH